jgi:hypothetical protein
MLGHSGADPGSCQVSTKRLLAFWNVSCVVFLEQRYPGSRRIHPIGRRSFDLLRIDQGETA